MSRQWRVWFCIHHPKRQPPSTKVTPVSFDLTVFASTVLDLEEVARLVDATATLQADASHPAALTVVRGARRAYCFTIDAPAALDPEDVPPEVTAVTMGVTAQYEIRVEGSDEVAVPFARRFGKKLATATEGALYDHQTDEVTTRAGLRKAARPTGTDRIDVVKLRWYVVTPVTSDIAEIWLACARAFLPEALPRRFGTYEPFPHKLTDADGADTFRLETQERYGMYFSTKFPVISGGISVGAETDGEPGFGNLHLTLTRDALFDERWRRSLERFFVAVAERTGSFFSVAQVARNTGWGGRSLWYDGREEEVHHLVQHVWMGLPPVPVWWCWFGDDYVGAVTPHVSASARIENGFVSFAEEPLDRDQLQDARPTTGFLRKRKKPWLPDELTCTLLEADPHSRNTPIRGAAWRPPSLAHIGEERARRRRIR